jgi:hypothetical protein
MNTGFCAAMWRRWRGEPETEPLNRFDDPVVRFYLSRPMASDRESQRHHMWMME